jgi:hypothetical protein
MDSDVLDSKYMLIRTLNVDTRFRSFPLNSSPTNFSFHLPNPLKNIIRLRLTSYEIPNTEYTFTNKKANCSFIIIDVYGEHLIRIDAGNYAINELILAIQLKLSELEGTYSINYINNKIHIEAFINFTLNFKIDSLLRRLADWGLGYNLGFRRRVNEGSDHYIADAFPKIEGEKYYFLEIQDANNMNSRGIDDSNLQAFTKILIDKPRGETIMNTISLTFRQEFIYQQPTNIVKLSIRLLDAYGEVVDLNGMDMSLTFELSEITDFKEYRHFLSKGGGQTDFWGSAIQARF